MPPTSFGMLAVLNCTCAEQRFGQPPRDSTNDPKPKGQRPPHTVNEAESAQLNDQTRNALWQAQAVQCSARSAGVFAFGRIAEKEVRLDLFGLAKARQPLRHWCIAPHSACADAGMAECTPNAAADWDWRTATVER